MKTKTVETGDSETSENYTVASSINKQINKYMTPPCDLLTWKDMPQHLQFNPYVHKGIKVELLITYNFNNFAYFRISTTAKY